MRIFLSVVLFLITCNIYGQKEANNWYFGHKAGLDFSTSPPTAITGELDTFEGASTISDDKGNLLFYSDGKTVWNKSHNVMNFSGGGSSLNALLGDPSSTQSALVIPKPNDSNIYYLFTVGANATSGLNYYTIDISKNGGLGEITAGPVELSGTASPGWSEKVTAVEGTDCDTFWIISTDRSNFYSYIVDVTGVNTTPVVSSFGQFINTRRGTLKISPDGKHVVLANQGDSSYLYNFNSLDGTINSPKRLNIGAGGYGVEFSQTSTMLYLSTGVHSQGSNTPNNAFVYQFNLNNTTITDINNSRKTIVSENGFRGALQLGIDGKIYYARSRSTYLGVINYPDRIGDDAEYVMNGQLLGAGSTSSEGLPPFIQSFFSPVKILDSDTKTINLTLGTHQVCIGDTFAFEPELDGLAGSTFKWTKTDDPSVNVTTRKITIDHTNFGSGSYNLEMLITDVCGRIKKYNGTVEILFVPSPELITIPTYEQCDFDMNPADGITSFNLESKINELTNSAPDLVVDFFEASDITYSNPIINKGNYRNKTSTNSGNYKLLIRATNTNGCETFGEIELKTNATSLSNYPDLYLTESDINASNPNARNSIGSANVFYDFDLKTTDIIANSGGAFSATTHSFEYYRTANDATLQTNQILIPFNDDIFTNDSNVFVRVSTIGTSACTGIGQFKIFVNTRPIPQGNITPQYLCVNNPIDNPQNITIDLNADTGITTDTYQWFLNGNLITGATNAIHKANTQGTYKVFAYRNYQNITSDPNDDTSSLGYNTFDVLESNKALVLSTDLVDNVDNPNENILTIKIAGIGDYEYALNSTSITNFTKGTDNLTFTFNEVKPGINTVYIRDLNGCGITSSQKLSFLFFQRHFTPNNDGVLDTWRILGANTNFYTSARVEIFDRYGKVVALITDKDNQGWNGTYNGKKLPSNDYWFNAVLEDINGNIRKETGHFSLLRK
jgi:gliding motility-associated-like protein